MSPICPWCGQNQLHSTSTKGVWECGYCGLTCLQGFKQVQPPSPWPTLEPLEGAPHATPPVPAKDK